MGTGQQPSLVRFFLLLVIFRLGTEVVAHNWLFTPGRSGSTAILQHPEYNGEFHEQLQAGSDANVHFAVGHTKNWHYILVLKRADESKVSSKGKGFDSFFNPFFDSAPESAQLQTNKKYKRVHARAQGSKVKGAPSFWEDLGTPTQPYFVKKLDWESAEVMPHRHRTVGKLGKRDVKDWYEYEDDLLQTDKMVTAYKGVDDKFKFIHAGARYKHFGVSLPLDRSSVLVPMPATPGDYIIYYR